MKKVSFSPDLFLDSLYNGYSSPFKDLNADELIKESESLRSKLVSILSVDKIPNKIAVLSVVVLKKVKRKNYTLEKISVEICKGWNMLCYILTPDKPNGKGVVAVCGHGYGVRQIIRQSKIGTYRHINFLDNYQKNFAEELAIRGNTVIAFEPVGFGEARLKKDQKKPFYISSCETVSAHTLLYGISTAALRIYQAQRCLDILDSMDCSELGMMGISGGGLVTLYTAAIDKRVSRAVVSGYVNSFKSSVLSRWHCFDNYIPGLLEHGEIYDYACLIAPRRLLVECGKKDKLFPIKAAEQAILHISEVYEKLGVKENFEFDIFDGKHSVSGRKSFDFFNE